jgi:hypothetical protein
VNDFPAVGAMFAVGAKESVIGVLGRDVKNSEGEGFVMNFSIVTLFLAILVIGLFLVVIVLIVMLTIRKCSRTRAGRIVMAEQSNQKLLSGSSDWPQSPVLSLSGYRDVKGVPVVLTQNSKFDLT